MAKKTVTVRTYVVCSGSGREMTEPTRDYAKAKAAVIEMRRAHPCEFFHLEDRTAEVNQNEEIQT